MVVVPAAPALLPGLGADVPLGYLDLLDRCDAVLGEALRGVREVVSVAAADPPDRDLARTGLGRTDRRTGWLVSAHLLDRAGFAGLCRRVRAEDAVAEGPAISDAQLVVVAADGSATVGPRSPRAGADGEPFDEQLNATLRTGALAALGEITDTAAARVGCTTAAAWRAIAGLGAGADWTVVSWHREAPYGVTTFVADLRAA